MPTLNWSKLMESDLGLSNTVIHEPWFFVVETERDFTHMRITCSGQWSPAQSDGRTYEANGLAATSDEKDGLQVADAPRGALIGKLGGSSANLTVLTSADRAAANPTTITEGKAFAIGSYCLTPLPPNFIGPLFVSFNGLSRPLIVTKLTISVEAATSG
jgi:hypothetical protein